MTVVSVSLPADGTTADVSDYNTPINTIVAAINGNLDSNNLASGAVTNAKMATDIAPYTVLDETTSDFVASGLTIPTSASLAATTASGVVYVNGRRLSVAADPHTYTASRDTYVDVDVNGALLYTPTTNNGTPPALAANSVRLAIVITSGTAVTSVNQGSTAATAPVISSQPVTVSDTLGNLIYPRNPNPGLVGYVQEGNAQANQAGPVDLTGATITFNVPTGGRDVELFGQMQFNATAGTNTIGQLQIMEGATQRAVGLVAATNTANGFWVPASDVVTFAAGVHTLKLTATAGGSNLNIARGILWAKFV